MRISLRIKKKDLVYFLLLIPIFEPDIFKNISFTDNFFTLFKAVAAIYLGVEYFKISRKPRFGWIIFLYILTLFISTSLNNQSLIFCFQKVIEVIVATMLIEVGITRLGIRAIDIVYKYLSFLIIIEFVSIIVFSNGMLASSAGSQNYKMFFLGIKNGFIPWAILLMACGFISYSNNKYRKEKNLLVLMYSICTACIILLKSTTAAVCWITFSVCIFSFIISKKERTVNFYKVIPVLIAVYFAVVIFQVQSGFSYVIETLFGKSATFTGRTNLWNTAILLIKEKPLYGYGIRQVEVIQTYYGRGFTAHNFFLYLLLCGGIISFAVIAFMIIQFIKISYVFKEFYVQKILSICLIAFFIATLTEAGIYNAKWFALFTLFGNMRTIANQIISRNSI